MEDRENTRLLALEVLLEVEKKKIFVKDALQKLLFQKQFLSKQDRAFIARLVEGTTEYQVRLDYVINLHSKTKINKCKPFIRCVLRMGVYQMLYMDSVPNQAACNECVKMTKKKGFQNLSGFVNGVLRNIERNLDHIVFPTEEENLTASLSLSYSMPEWIVKEMLSWYGTDRVKDILEASLSAPDITIRVNTAKITPEKLKKKLEHSNIEVIDGHYVPEAFHLKKINYVKRIPGFKTGEFFVQDESSMLLGKIGNPKAEFEAWEMSDAKESEEFHVLDLCAAPGGKSTHFAQLLKDKTIIEARDLTEKKVVLIDENIERLEIPNMQTVVWDALVPDREKCEWADIVIADLPCSGLGIISKKNDIKYHLRKEQLVELANLQRTILANAADYVKPGGILLYSTCTINPKENIENAEWFTKHFSFEEEDIHEFVPESLQQSIIGKNMLQLLPGEAKCDGFFIAKFRKIGKGK